MVPSLQEAAARRFEEGLESAPTKEQTEVHQKNVGNFALRGCSEVEFEARRGVRVVYGDGLENRCSRKGTVGSNPTPSATNGVQPRQYSAQQDPWHLIRTPLHRV